MNSWQLKKLVVAHAWRRAKSLLLILEERMFQRETTYVCVGGVVVPAICIRTGSSNNVSYLYAWERRRGSEEERRG